MTSLQDIAQQYVALVLATGQHDPDYVDAYYGPPEWKAEAQAHPQTLTDLQAQAEQLQQRLASLGRDRGPRGDVREAEMLGWRKAYLKRQIGALRTRLTMLSGTRLPFDEESLALYDAAARERTEEEFRTVLEALSRLLSCAGSVLDRYVAFRVRYVVPPACLPQVCARQAVGQPGRVDVVATVGLQPPVVARVAACPGTRGAATGLL